MFRKQITGGKREHGDRITWRSHEVTRIEAFSDAVFAFAITLLIVSLEVPKSIDELLEGMRSFLSFAICFAMLFGVWMTQNVYFRRFGLSDDLTLVLNAMLLFTVLFFVYPLKFLFSTITLQGHLVAKEEDIVHLFYIYSGGFTAIYLLFTAMYWNALRKRHVLGLTGSEVFEAKTNIYRHLVTAGVGLLSIFFASLGGKYLGYAGMVYFLLGPAIAMTHSRRAKIHRLKYEAAQDE